MPDMDVIVKSLRRCSDMTICPDDCSYRKYAPDCVAKLHRDAIALLKDQNELLKQQDELLEVKDERIKNLEHKLKEQEAKTGHWIPIKSPTGVEAFGIKEMTVFDVRCSVCGAEEDVSFTGYKYCPRCGAKMEGR